MTNEELAAAVRAGKLDRLLELWEGVRRFAMREARRWCGARRGGMEVSDFMQAAFLALLDALEGFKPEYGQFITWYAVRLKAAFTVAAGQRTQRDRRDPLQSAASLDAPLTDSEGGPLRLEDVIEDPGAAAALEAVEDRERLRRLHAVLYAAIAELPEDQRAALRARYWRGVDCDRKAHDAALRALRHPRVSRQLLALWR